MPFSRCIAAALKANVIDEEAADAYRESFAAHEEALVTSMTPHEAAAEAGRMTFAEIEGDVAERRRQTFLTLAAQQDITRRLDSFKSYKLGEFGKANPYLAAGGLYDRLQPNRNGLAVEQQREFWRGQAHALMDDAFRAYRQDLAGRQGRRAVDDNVVAEAFGHDTGDAQAKAITGGWIKARELLRAAFNRFGGHIGELADYGFPQTHSQPLINKVSFETWRDFLKAVPGGIKLVSENGRALTGKRFDTALEEMYNSIVTNGWDDRVATTRNPRMAALANRHAEHRFMQFNSPDGWLAYQRRFGEGNIFDTMMSHIETMSRDIGHMEVLGPNPRSTLQWLKNDLERRAALSRDAKQLRQAKSASRYLDDLYAQYSGAANMPGNQLAAEIEGDVRNVATSALLGSATLTAVPTDMNYSRMTRAMNGLPQVKALGAYLKLLNPKSPEDRMLAVRLGMTAEGYARTLHDSARVMDQVYGHEWSKWLADRALTWNLLRPHTEAVRWSYGWNAQGALADFAGKDWAALDSKFREGLQRYGVDAADWNVIRATKVYQSRGASFIRPGDIMARGDIPQSQALGVARKVADWLMSETEFAVPSSSLAARAQSRGLIRPGTLYGTLLSSPLMFKTFALTYLLSHGRRMLARADWSKRGQYAASLFVLSTFAGAIATQLREIANGRDPQDMTDGKFWAKSAATGGGAGMFGDLAFAATNSAGRDMASTLAGPQAGLIADIAKLGLGQPIAAAEAKDARTGQSGLANNAVSFVKRWTPGSSTWYARLALERYVFDAIQEEVDPNWKARVRRVEHWYNQNTGQDFWWRRGDQPGLDGSNVRAPDLEAVVGSPNHP